MQQVKYDEKIPRKLSKNRNRLKSQGHFAF